MRRVAGGGPTRDVASGQLGTRDLACSAGRDGVSGHGRRCGVIVVDFVVPAAAGTSHTGQGGAPARPNVIACNACQDPNYFESGRDVRQLLRGDGHALVLLYYVAGQVRGILEHEHDNLTARSCR